MVDGYGYGTGCDDTMNTPDWWGVAFALACCLFVPTTIVLYMLMARVEQMWKNAEWRW